NSLNIYMQKGKVLRFCHKYLVSNDGYDLDIQDICKSTSDLYENYVITFVKGSTESYVKKNNLKKKGFFFYHKGTKSYIYPIKLISKHENYVKDLYMWKNIKNFQVGLKRCKNNINPSIIHIHGTLIPQFFYAAIEFRKKHVISTHHIGLINQNYHRQKLYILFFKFLIHNIFPFINDRIICNSRYGKKSFLFKRNISVINPIPPRKKSSKKDIAHILKSNLIQNNFSINRKDNIFLMVGRISKQKNQLSCIKAFNKSLEINPNMKLILVGEVYDNIYFKKILEEIKKNLNNYFLIDSLENDYIEGLIEFSDFILTPTFNEGFGRLAMESIMRSKPVIASKNNGYSEFLDESNSILVDPDSVKEISYAIINIKYKNIKINMNHKKYIQEIIDIYRGGKNES
ncbi:MAG: glycosyltransferase family 4 protein, partial [bacterium]